MRANEVFQAFIGSCEEGGRFDLRSKTLKRYVVAGIALSDPSRNSLDPWIAVGFDEYAMDCVYVGVNLQNTARRGAGRRLSACLLHCLGSNGFPVSGWKFSDRENEIQPNNWPVWKDYEGLAAIKVGTPEADALIRQMCDDMKALAAALEHCHCI